MILEDESKWRKVNDLAKKRFTETLSIALSQYPRHDEEYASPGCVVGRNEVRTANIRNCLKIFLGSILTRHLHYSVRKLLPHSQRRPKIRFLKKLNQRHYGLRNNRHWEMQKWGVGMGKSGKISTPRPDWCDSVDWALACEPKGCRFISQSEHMSGLLARSPAGGSASSNHTLMFLSLSFSFPSLLYKLNK